MKEPELPHEDAFRESTNRNSYSVDSDRWDHTYVKKEWPPAEVRVKQETELPEDSECRKEATDCVDENAAWSNTHKQEPSCVVSEAALLAALYTDHAVKDELVLGPEGVQHPSLLDALCSSNWPVTLKQEPPDSPETVSSRECVAPDAMLTNTQTHNDVTSSVNEEASEDQFDRNKTVEETRVFDGCSEEFKLKKQLISHVTDHILNDSESGFADDSKNASNQASVMQPRRQPTLRECLVRLERIPHHDVLLMQTAARRPRVVYDARGNGYVCDSCGKIYQQKCKLIQHIQLHMRRRNPKKSNNIHGRVKSQTKTCGMCSKSNGCKCKPYICDICGNRFKQSCHLARHYRIHTGKNLYPCDMCNKKFTRLNNLRDHKRIHTVHNLYRCEICNKQFSQLRSLKAHKRIHTGEKLFMSDTSYSGQFTRLSSFKAHKRIHTGEKPFMCDICKMKFARLHTVNRHKRTHTGEMSYSCQICKKEFTRLSNFKEHKRIHTGQKPYSCDVCKKRFTRLSSLRSHERNFHMPDKS